MLYSSLTNITTKSSIHSSELCSTYCILIITLSLLLRILKSIITISCVLQNLGTFELFSRSILNSLATVPKIPLALNWFRFADSASQWYGHLMHYELCRDLKQTNVWLKIVECGRLLCWKSRFDRILYCRRLSFQNWRSLFPHAALLHLFDHHAYPNRSTFVAKDKIKSFIVPVGCVSLEPKVLSVNVLTTILPLLWISSPTLCTYCSSSFILPETILDHNLLPRSF